MKKIILGLYLGTMIGGPLLQIGRVLPKQTVGWGLPITMALILIIPTILGYLIGKED